MNVLARILCSQARRLVPGMNWWNAAYALAEVSWTRSAASQGFLVIRSAAGYSWPRNGRTSCSNRLSWSGTCSLGLIVAPLFVNLSPYRRSGALSGRVMQATMRLRDAIALDNRLVSRCLRRYRGPRLAGPAESDPAVAAGVIPHPGQPGSVRDGLGGQHRVHVGEVRQHGDQVGAGDGRARRPAGRAGPRGADEQPDAERDRDHQERVEHHRVEVEHRAVVVPGEPEPGQPAGGHAGQHGAGPPVPAGKPPAQADDEREDGSPPDGRGADREHLLLRGAELPARDRLRQAL